jgi:hypothetical protein
MLNLPETRHSITAAELRQEFINNILPKKLMTLFADWSLISEEMQSVSDSMPADLPLQFMDCYSKLSLFTHRHDIEFRMQILPTEYFTHALNSDFNQFSVKAALIPTDIEALLIAVAKLIESAKLMQPTTLTQMEGLRGGVIRCETFTTSSGMNFSLILLVNSAQKLSLAFAPDSYSPNSTSES